MLVCLLCYLIFICELVVAVVCVFAGVLVLLLLAGVFWVCWANALVFQVYGLVIRYCV